MCPLMRVANESSGHLEYRAEIDGLRALAVLPVILFHAGFEPFHGGYVGVDIFFVISGYLITTIILQERSNGDFSIVNFYERRARRILPALFVVLAVCFPFAWFWMTPGQFGEFTQSVLAVSVFGSNILFWKTSGYFDFSSEEKPLLHTWSLAVEEQYYVLFPLLVLLLWRLGRKRQFWIFVGLAGASLLLSEWGWRHARMASFYLAPTRTWEILIGSILAFASFEAPLHRRVGKRPTEALSIVGLAAILFSIFVYEEQTPFPSVYALVPTLGTALIIAFAHKGTVVARLLSWRWPVRIGLISYSAYLWHQPLFAFARIRLPTRPSSWTFLLLSFLTLVLAYLTWRFVESPFRNRARFRRRAVFSMAAFGSAVFITAGATLHLQTHLSPSTLALVRSAEPSPKREACHTSGPDFLEPAKACRYFRDKVTWAVLGDSHAVEPAYALAQTLERQGEGLLHLSFSACPPALSVRAKQPGCSDWLERSVRHLEESRDIHNVLVAFRYSYHFFGDHTQDYPELPDARPVLELQDAPSDQARERLWRSFAGIVHRLERSGKRVFVLLPVPELDMLIQKKIVLSDGADPVRSARGTSRNYFEERNRYILEKMKGLSWSERLIPIAPASALCSAQDCRAIIDGAAMYYDNNHLSLKGATRVLASLRGYVASSNPPQRTIDTY
jgi:peptidoglycan/LPS O-acetylase OafA/YrhL